MYVLKQTFKYKTHVEISNELIIKTIDGSKIYSYCKNVTCFVTKYLNTGRRSTDNGIISAPTGA